MSEIESDICEDASCDPHQVRAIQCTLAGDSPVQKTQGKTYTESARCRGKRGRRETSEEGLTTTTTLQADRSMTYPLSPTIVHTGHSMERDGSPPALSRDVI